MERNKPVIAWDSAYPAKSITTPVNLLSILLASSSQFRIWTFHRTRAGQPPGTKKPLEMSVSTELCDSYLTTDFPGRLVKK